jgi:hypothetical protein
MPMPANRVFGASRQLRLEHGAQRDFADRLMVEHTGPVGAHTSGAENWEQKCKLEDCQNC